MTALSVPVVPPALRRGDTIAFVAPSARINHIFPLRIARARAFLESQGFLVREIYTILPTFSFRANLNTRVEELHEAFRDDAVRAIVCCIGGLTANEILPHLDYQLIREHPKIFIGSSDITLLHHALLVGAGLRTFYGLGAIVQLGEYPMPLDFTWNHFLRVLCVEPDKDFAPSPEDWLMPRSLYYTDEFLDWCGEPDNLRARKTKPSPGWKWLRPGRAQGRIFGGCLPSILQLFGTSWQVSYKGRILLVELPEGMQPDTPWPLELVRCNLADLGTRGVWDDITGLILGRPYRHTEEQLVEWEKLVLDITEDYNFPILAGVDVGHTDPMLTVSLDALCLLDSEKDEWAILERGVKY
ncbi:hypothetical protein TCE0_011r00708 [Talaromyces pinophilus]|uniref:LD-carboxypeptidase n=1 Tax=Talaromyces pinophilus TaxID=128442 RepID=A0A0B8MXL6_TALPI|nr:hypothetical protein TCE0_011r00708 [Talaromyces pinophilus]